MHKLELYSVAACPYAQRTRILLQHKQIKYELIELDLSKPRPDWFKKINPTGRVPAIVFNGQALGESSIINEFLEDVFPEKSLWPSDSFMKAQGRALIDFCNNKFTSNLYRVLMEQDRERRTRAEAAAAADWNWLEAELDRMGANKGLPFGELSMVDLTFAPFFQRYELNSYFWNFQPPKLERVEAWIEALAADPSVQATTSDQQSYIKLYADYALGYANGAIPPGKQYSALDMSIPLDSRPLPERRINSG